MKNHFITFYTGNKREEVEDIYKGLDLKNIDTICEPFCGTSAVSFYISKKHPKKYTYILNDIDDKLIRLYESMRDPIKWQFLRCMFELQINAINDKKYYNKIVNQKGVISYLIAHKYYHYRAYVYPSGENCPNSRKKKPLLKSNYPIIDFMRTENVILHNKDAIEILKEYNKKNIIHILDPPYLFTCNSFYNDANLVKDDFNIYEHLYKNSKKYKTNIYIILEKIWFIEGLYKDKIIYEYKKNYNGFRKKKSIHCIIKV